jgi:hypothetical protein
MRSMQQKFGIWEPSQHLLEDRGKPRKPGEGISNKLYLMINSLPQREHNTSPL